ncbi:TolB family protein [Spirilliplanes yamanashiensis]|uniref:TolB family protein n=1 Tax=Spirilliplanes yamanashiensis TaxID=42233 RepID=UPI00194ECE36|nr:PD40 domain-containing protein [Spirilliplanes yamanashiensis]MDP9815034.1 Tol biopolymer transport system component [Spirilliplanes yamanashiensis]
MGAAPSAWADEPAGTSRVTIGYDGEEANGSSTFSAISGDGRVVAFQSNALNIVRGDLTRNSDVFVRDLATGVSSRVSVSSAGVPSRGSSSSVALSYDGRVVVFQSAASDLVPGDTNKVADIFVHDRETGATTRVSVATDGTEGNGPSTAPQVSADGRWVTFGTTATNLAPGAVGPKSKVLLHDRETGATTEVSVRPDGTSGTADSQLPTISADGRYVAFLSYDWRIVPAARSVHLSAYVRDVQAGTTVRINNTPLSSLGYAIPKPHVPVTVSADGRYASILTDGVMVEGDDNRVTDVYRVELATGAVVRVSVGADGVQADRASGLTVTGAPMSADGRYVAFDSEARNLVADDANEARDIFVRDTVDGTTTRVSAGAVPSTRGSYFPAISADGGAVVFSTDGALVDGDTNNLSDIHLHRLR